MVTPTYVKVDSICVMVASHMLMFGITYVIVAITYVNVGHKPSVKVTYEKFNIILL